MYREDIIIPLVTDKCVLDCGGIDHWAMELKLSRGEWLHDLLVQHAASCIGVDILEEHVKKINKQEQYHFITANVENLPFRDEFDVVIAGEIVEHLYNMGLFLDSAWNALKEGGILIITTPNSYALSSIIYAVLLGKELCHPEHTCYYSKKTLSYIIAHHGFVIEQFYTLPRHSRSRIVELFRSFICKRRPMLGEKLVIVARKGLGERKYIDKW